MMASRRLLLRLRTTELGLLHARSIFMWIRSVEDWRLARVIAEHWMRQRMLYNDWRESYILCLSGGSDTGRGL